MPPPADDALQPLYDFAERWLDRALGDQERVRLKELAIAMATGQPASQLPAMEQRAANVIDAERERVQALIARMLAGAQDSARREVQARGGEAATLKAVRASPTLDDLRPSSLRASQAGETSTERLVITQIADRLGNLIRAEVDACFNKRFGPAQPAASAQPDPVSSMYAPADAPPATAAGRDLPPD